MEENTSIPTDSHTPVATPVKKANLPATDIDLGSLVTKVSANWLANTWLTLQWTTYGEFSQQGVLFNNLITQKTQQGSNRPQITGTFKVLDKQVNSSIGYIKGYLADKYGKDIAPDHYAAFGIVKKDKVYMIPKDHDARKEALAQMLTGIAAENFTNNTYGLNFWADIKARFDAAMELAYQTDSGMSQKTGNKNVLKTELKKVLNAIVLILKANYPDTWKTELRTWGFQKEKY